MEVGSFLYGKKPKLSAEQKAAIRNPRNLGGASCRFCAIGPDFFDQDFLNKKSIEVGSSLDRILAFHAISL